MPRRYGKVWFVTTKANLAQRADGRKRREYQMTHKSETKARLRVTAGGLISIDGEERNCLVLEGDTKQIREGSRYWGEKVVLMSEAEYCALVAARSEAGA